MPRAQRNFAQENEATAVAEAERAERELARANEIKRLITEMFTSVDPEDAPGPPTRLCSRASSTMSRHDSPKARSRMS